MQYKNIHEGIFVERPHRFGATVLLDGKAEYVHVKNTGRCREILIPGARVFLEKSNNPNRKTKYSLISAYKGEMLINIDSQVPNTVVYDSLLQGAVKGFPIMSYLKREVVYGNSRFDIYYEDVKGDKGFIEVKGVTLDIDSTAMFPDAPTTRGRKHLLELANAANNGFCAHVVFLIQYKPADFFRSNRITDPAFADALNFAFNSGVLIHAYDCEVSENGIEMGSPVSVLLG